MKSKCPVCSHLLNFQTWNDNRPSDEICPSCGIQFGYDDARADLRSAVYQAWRKAWLANGKQKVDPKAVKLP
jgi:Zn ribbon nucleic-acid-binding protein